MDELFSEHTRQILRILMSNDPCKRLFLHGPPGASKTFTVETLLKDNNYTPIYLDAAEIVQNKLEIFKFVDKVLGAAFPDPSFRKCLVVDNIRGDYVKEPDRDTKMVIDVLSAYLTGGEIDGCPKLKARTTHNLLIVISDCNISKNVKELSKVMNVFHFKPYDAKKMETFAKRLAVEKKLNLSDDLLSSCAIEADGDIRQLELLIHLQALRPSEPQSKRVDSGDSFSADLFKTTRLLLSKRGSDKERQDLVECNTDMLDQFMFQNYTNLYSVTGKRKRDDDVQSALTRDCETLKLLTEHSDCLGTIDLFSSQYYNEDTDPIGVEVHEAMLISKRFSTDKKVELGFPAYLRDFKKNRKTTQGIKDKCRDLIDPESSISLITPLEMFEFPQLLSNRSPAPPPGPCEYVEQSEEPEIVASDTSQSAERPAGRSTTSRDAQLCSVKWMMFAQLEGREPRPDAYTVNRWERNPTIIFFNKLDGLRRFCLNTEVEHVEDNSFMARVDDRTGDLFTKCCKCTEAGWKYVTPMMSDLKLNLGQWQNKVNRIVTYEEDRMRPLSECIQTRVTLQLAGMGVGKTYVADQLLSDQNLLRELVNKHCKWKLGPSDPVRVFIGPTNRESLANSAADNYQLLKDRLTFYNNTAHVPGTYFVGEYESLYRLLDYGFKDTGCFGYHVIHADELESIWISMTSEATNHSHLSMNKRIFTDMLQECLVIASEALPTTRTMDMLTKICRPEEVSVYNNTCVKNPKTITVFKLDVKGQEIEDDPFACRIINEVSKRNRQVLVSGSLGYLKKFEEAIMTRYPTLNAKFYDGHSAAQKKAEVRNPDMNWRVDCLGFTGVFTVGISDNVEGWFSEINMLVTQSDGSLARDLFQASMRARYTSTNKLYICVPATPNRCDKPATFTAIKEMFLHKRDILTKFERQVMAEADLRTRFQSETDWFVDLLCWNTLERNLQEVNTGWRTLELAFQLKWPIALSNEHYHDEDEKIPMSDGTLANHVEGVKEIQVNEWRKQHVTLKSVFEEPSTTKAAYEAAPDNTEEQKEQKKSLKAAWDEAKEQSIATDDSYKRLEKLKRDKKHSERDSYLSEIHRFKKFFSPDFQSRLTFKQFSGWSRQLNKMFRVIKATKINQSQACQLPSYLKDLGVPPGEDSMYENRERYAEMVKIDVPYVALQNKLCQAMGLQHCLDFATAITKAQIESKRADITQILKQVSDLTAGSFSIDPQKLDRMKYKAFFGKLDSELAHFGQLTLQRLKQGRSRRNGTDTTNPSYKLAWRELAGLSLQELIENKV